MTVQPFDLEIVRREPLIKLDTITLNGYYALEGQPNTLAVIERSGELYTMPRFAPALTGRECIERSLREFGRLLRTTFKIEQCRNGSTRFWKGVKLHEGSGTGDVGSSAGPTLAELMPY